MLLEVLAELVVVLGLIRRNLRLTVNVGFDDRHQFVGVGAANMEAAGVAATLYQRQDCHLLVHAVRLGKALGGLLFADERLVYFHVSAATTHWGQRARAHGLADAVAHEPSRIVLNLKDAVQLMAADALL